jgi:hypothetical protein
MHATVTGTEGVEPEIPGTNALNKCKSSGYRKTSGFLFISFSFRLDGEI